MSDYAGSSVQSALELTARYAVDPREDLPPVTESVDGCGLIYLFDRSRDTKYQNAPGQDFLCYQAARYNGSPVFVFAICDGVSQSFYGDLAAGYMGVQLVDYLLTFSGRSDVITVDALFSALTSWVEESNPLTDQKPIPESLPGLVKSALEQKRAYGSETMFIGGLVDYASDRVTLVWMGDMTARVFDPQGVEIPLDPELFLTRERWSTRNGARNGYPHIQVWTIGEIGRILVHSDGVGSLADQLTDSSSESLAVRMSNVAAAQSESPASDDISILDIRLDRGYRLRLADKVVTGALSRSESITTSGRFRLKAKKNEQAAVQEQAPAIPIATPVASPAPVTVSVNDPSPESIVQSADIVKVPVRYRQDAVNLVAAALALAASVIGFWLYMRPFIAP